MGVPVFQPDLAENFVSRPWWKFFQQTLLENFQSDLAWKILNAIVIVIAIVIRINRTLIEKSWADFCREMISSCGWDEPDAQKVLRLLRCSLTCTRTCGRALAQRGVDRPPSDSMRSMEGKASPFQFFFGGSRDDGTSFPNLNEDPDPDNLYPESDVTKQFWKNQ